MKRVIIVVIVCTVAVFGLQGLWVRSMYRAYIHQSQETMEKAMDTSIGKEIAYRKKEQPFKDPKNPKVIYKFASEMTPEERNSLKGDTLNYNELSSKNIGNNIYEVLLQISQDRLIEKKRYIKLNILDSLFHSELQKAEVEARYRIFIYNRDTTVMHQTGTLGADAEATSSTQCSPSARKGNNSYK